MASTAWDRAAFVRAQASCPYRLDYDGRFPDDFARQPDEFRVAVDASWCLPSWMKVTNKRIVVVRADRYDSLWLAGLVAIGWRPRGEAGLLSFTFANGTVYGPLYAPRAAAGFVEHARRLMSAAGARPADPVAQLERLAALRRAGALSEREFEAAKRRIIAGS